MPPLKIWKERMHTSQERRSTKTVTEAQEEEEAVRCLVVCRHRGQGAQGQAHCDKQLFDAFALLRAGPVASALRSSLLL